MAPSSPSRALPLAAALAVTVTLTGCASIASHLTQGGRTGSAQDQRASAGLLKVHDPKQVTYSLHFTSCQFGDGGQLPDPRCTPGAIDPAVTQSNLKSTICRHGGYTKKVRPSSSETSHAKYDVAYPAYGVSHSRKSELDHLVSLELGGSNDIANLWPEVGKEPNPKDAVENDLHKAVCDGDVSLAAAQKAIAANWETAESRLGLSG